MSTRYEVDVLRDPEDVPTDHLLRFKVCLERRLERLAGRGEPVQQGGTVDILDAFEGPFVWEMTPAQLEETPPTSVMFTVESMESSDGVIRVVARLCY